MHQILRGSRSGFPFTSAKVWVLACCCVTLVGAVQDTVPKTDATVTADGGGDPSVREAAMAAYDKEDYAGAVDLLKDAHALDPGDAEVAGRLGFAAKETGAYELALKALDSAVELAPDNYYYWWWLSDTQRLLGRYADALQNMERARDLAPSETREELQAYVAYTSILAGDTPSWENVDQHLNFAERHRKMRRVRRQIEEYVNALDVAPAVEPGDMKALGRLAWTCQQIGVQYIYIEEPDPAIDYLKQALLYMRDSDMPSEIMRQEQFLAIAFQLKAEREPGAAAGCYETAVSHWNRALDASRAAEDVAYTRYVQGRLLEVLSRFRPLDDPALTALRAANLKEVPWQGPVNEYSTADAVYGEAQCRLREGDYAGARILLEMAAEYFDQSQYLSDYQRAVELHLHLAWVFFQQEHVKESLDQAAQAGAKIDEARKFMDADTFNRSAAKRGQQRVAAARARAYVAQSKGAEAFAAVETFNALDFRTLLGALLVDDTRRTDATSEKSVVRRRIPHLESALAAAREAGDAQEAARLEERLAADGARLQWLERGLSFVSSQTLNFESLPPATFEEAQGALDAGALLVGFLFDDRGGTAVCLSQDEVKGVLLQPNESEIRTRVQAVRDAQEGDALRDASGALYEALFAPLAPLPEGKALAIVPDACLIGAPFEAMEAAGAWKSFVYTQTASRLIALNAQPGTAPARLRYVKGRAGMDETLCGGTGPFNPPRCLEGESLTLPAVISDVQADEALHLGCVLNQAAPDALLSELIFGEASVDTTLPVARLLGMKIPASVVVLDWAPPQTAPVFRGDVVSAAAGLLHSAGAGAVLVVAPQTPPEVRTRFFTSFYGQLPSLGVAGAVQAARQAVMAEDMNFAQPGAFMLFGGLR